MLSGTLQPYLEPHMGRALVTPLLPDRFCLGAHLRVRLHEGGHMGPPLQGRWEGSCSVLCSRAGELFVMS